MINDEQHSNFRLNHIIDRLIDSLFHSSNNSTIKITKLSNQLPIGLNCVRPIFLNKMDINRPTNEPMIRSNDLIKPVDKFKYNYRNRLFYSSISGYVLLLFIFTFIFGPISTTGK